MNASLALLLTLCVLASAYRLPSRVISRTKSGSILSYGPPQIVDPNAEYSFVNDELRPYAMKLHTKAQAPKEGEAPAVPQTPYTVTRQDYLCFLTDSLRVYEVFEEIMSTTPGLEPFISTGLERTAALKEDIKWMLEYDKTLTEPKCGASGEAYAALLKDIAKKGVPGLMCHYYNHYFAHTAGGRMIGTKFSTNLLEGQKLKFYQWDGEVRTMLGDTTKKIDAMASTWSDEEKLACKEQTENVFKYSGGLMSYFRGPG